MQNQMMSIARGEFARQRRRLGSLTSQQELALDDLLKATVEQISVQIMMRVQNFPEETRRRYTSLWGAVESEPTH
jgi:hypothetical protein